MSWLGDAYRYLGLERKFWIALCVVAAIILWIPAEHIQGIGLRKWIDWIKLSASIGLAVGVLMLCVDIFGAIGRGCLGLTEWFSRWVTFRNLQEDEKQLLRKVWKTGSTYMSVDSLSTPLVLRLKQKRIIETEFFVSASIRIEDWAVTKIEKNPQSIGLDPIHRRK